METEWASGCDGKCCAIHFTSTEYCDAWNSNLAVAVPIPRTVLNFSPTECHDKLAQSRGWIVNLMPLPMVPSRLGGLLRQAPTTYVSLPRSHASKRPHPRVSTHAVLSWQEAIERTRGSPALEDFVMMPAGSKPSTAPSATLSPDTETVSSKPVVLYRDTNAWCECPDQAQYMNQAYSGRCLTAPVV